MPLSFAFGFLTDLYDWMIPEISAPLAVDFILFILTMFITGMGVFLCVQTNLVLTPTDGIVKTISDVFKLPFSLTKNVFDISLVVISALLCLFNHAPFYGIGVGTVLTAVFIGRIIKIYEKKVHLPLTAR